MNPFRPRENDLRTKTGWLAPLGAALAHKLLACGVLSPVPDWQQVAPSMALLRIRHDTFLQFEGVPSVPAHYEISSVCDLVNDKKLPQSLPRAKHGGLCKPAEGRGDKRFYAFATAAAVTALAIEAHVNSLPQAQHGPVPQCPQVCALWQCWSVAGA